MQTFVPLTDFRECARVLDMKRLGKQRVECTQILAALRASRTANGASLPVGWSRHPATLMWRGYESALGVYMTFVVAEWSARGYENNMITPYSRKTFLLNPGWGADDEFVADGRDAELPPWWGDDRVHASHRKALLYKDHDHYRQFRWSEFAELNYFWPVATDREWTPEPVHPGSMFQSVIDRRKRTDEPD